MVGLVTTAAGTSYGFTKQSDRLEGIEKNTNGRLHARDQETESLRAALKDQGTDPDAVTGSIDTGDAD